MNLLLYFNSNQTLSTMWKPSPANGCAVGILMGDKVLASHSIPRCLVLFKSGILP